MKLKHFQVQVRLHEYGKAKVKFERVRDASEMRSEHTFNTESKRHL